MVDLRKNHPFDPQLKRAIPEELFADMGCRLILLQDMEMFIAFVAKVAFAESCVEARDEILRADRKTLGQLLIQLRKRVTISPSFDDCLKRTLDARNFFIHEFSHEFDVRTENGAKNALRFLDDTTEDLKEVSNVMRALIVLYAKDQSSYDEELQELEEHWRSYGDLDRLESQYLPKISSVIRAKS